MRSPSALLIRVTFTIVISNLIKERPFILLLTWWSAHWTLANFLLSQGGRIIHHGQALQPTMDELCHSLSTGLHSSDLFLLLPNLWSSAPHFSSPISFRLPSGGQFPLTGNQSQSRCLEMWSYILESSGFWRLQWPFTLAWAVLAYLSRVLLNWPAKLEIFLPSKTNCENEFSRKYLESSLGSNRK